MMYPRLALLREFLREDGVIFVSIDDNEVGSLRLLMEEIFGAANSVATIAWQRRTSPDARLGLSQAHDHIVVFAKSKPQINFHPIPLSSDQTKSFKNPDNDPNGLWVSTDFTAQGWRPNQMYEIETPGGAVFSPPPGRCWANIEGVYRQLVSDGRMWFGKNGNGRPRIKTYLSESAGVRAWTWWGHQDCGHNQEAKKEINEIVGHDVPFDTPKPTRLIQRILQISTDKDSLILDSFAGSGTTGHAALKQNAADGGSRQFISVEMDENIAENVTAKRLSKVSEKLKGGFRYCRLGNPLFDETGSIAEGVTFPDLASHIFFSETGSPIPKKATGKTPLLGTFNERAVYLLFNGVLGATGLKDRVVGKDRIVVKNGFPKAPDDTDRKKVIQDVKTLIRAGRAMSPYRGTGVWNSSDTAARQCMTMMRENQPRVNPVRERKWKAFPEGSPGAYPLGVATTALLQCVTCSDDADSECADAERLVRCAEKEIKAGRADESMTCVLNKR